MKEIINWLMRDEQKELYEAVLAIAIGLIFLALTALLLWPLDRSAIVLPLAKGYFLFWLILSVTAWIVNLLHRLFRMDLYSHPDAYVLSALAVSGILQTGWSAFASLTVDRFAEGSPLRVSVILYTVGILSCYIAFLMISAFYPGHIYKMVNLPLACVSFIIFSVWPVSGHYNA